MLFSGGDCPVCGCSGDLICVLPKDRAEFFFFCPSCGCAFRRPPPKWHLDTVDPVWHFAPHGIRLPAKREILDANLWHLVEREVAEERWLDLIAEYFAEPKTAQ